jgi:hypothetical protein
MVADDSHLRAGFQLPIGSNLVESSGGPRLSWNVSWLFSREAVPGGALAGLIVKECLRLAAISRKAQYQ